MRPPKIRAPRRHAPVVLTLEGRASASVLVGAEALSVANPASNRGRIVDSQYQPWGYALLGRQWRGVSLRGSLSIASRYPFNRAAGVAGGSPAVPVVNAGTIGGSLFNVGGFSLVGLQWWGVAAGGSILVDVYDESPGQPRSGGSPSTPEGARTAPVPLPVPMPTTNSGGVLASQFNDGGFGDLGAQWLDVAIGGDANIVSRSYIRYPDGQGPVPEVAATASTAGAIASKAGVNTGLIEDNQFNDGGFGNVGLQWRDVAVGGSVSTSYETWTVHPGTTGGGPRPIVAPAGNDPSAREPSANETNRGRLVGGQFNDGGFGDIGYQWRGVRVAGSVATSYNGVSIQPIVDNTGPITLADLDLGRAGPPAANPFAAVVATAGASGSIAGASLDSSRGLVENDATNSGVVLDGQFSDGGFGDIGLQWRDVTVGGSVLAVHNALSVQPENAGQGVIRMSRVQFPSLPWERSSTGGAASRTLAADPAPISGEGGVPGPLPEPTRYRDRSIPVNRATNSGPITGGQFSDGGFGDVGLQWRNVSVGGAVRLVHNSLSIQPEGADLAGVRVSGVRFGPLPATPPAGTGLKHPRKNTPRTSRPITLTIRPPKRGNPRLASRANREAEDPTPQARGATNSAFLKDRQAADSAAANVSFRWLNTYRIPGNLVIVQNVLSVRGWGKDTGRIRLRDVQLAAGTPRVNGLRLASALKKMQGRPGGASVASAGAGRIRPSDDATNSGRLRDAQFSDGGFGDVGLQWRDVSVGGSVDVIHNSLSIDVSATNTGPIRVDDVSFASGVLDAVPPGPRTRWVVPPPRHVSRTWSPPFGTVRPLPRAEGPRSTAANNGIIAGGQSSDGGFGNVALQASGIHIAGRVTIVHNVLEVQTSGHKTGPITLSRVRFE